MTVHIRHVAPIWNHPKSGDGTFIPLHQYPQPDSPEAQLMPQWTDAEKTHFQFYENLTEGTPVSPVFSNKTQLAEWLFENQETIYHERKYSKETIPAVVEMLDLEEEIEKCYIPNWEPFYGYNNNPVKNHPRAKGGIFTLKGLSNHLGKPLSQALWIDIILKFRVRYLRIFKHNEPTPIEDLYETAVILLGACRA